LVKITRKEYRSFETSHCSVSQSLSPKDTNIVRQNKSEHIKLNRGTENSSTAAGTAVPISTPIYYIFGAIMWLFIAITGSYLNVTS
jgi:hypothetical protein